MVNINISDFLTWQSLATFAGASLATAVLTELLKGAADLLPIRFPTRLLSYIIATVILILAEVFSPGPSVADAVLCLINGALVSLCANGSYDLVSSMLSDKTVYDCEKEDGGDEDNT